MISLISKEEYKNIRKDYKNKIVLVVPYGEKKVGEIKKKMKVVFFKKNGKAFYDFTKSGKYAKYEYFVVISLTDVFDKIHEVEKKVKEILNGDLQV